MNGCADLCDKTGQLVLPSEKAFAIWLFMGEDTKMKAERKGLTESVTPFRFEEVCYHLEKLGNDEHNKKASADYAKRRWCARTCSG